jgi:hypothetical protein
LTVRLGTIVLTSLLAVTVSACAQQAGGAGATAPTPNADTASTDHNGAAASCIGPELSTRAKATLGVRARAVTVSPGHALQVYGFGYQTCNDVNPNLGPSGSPFPDLAIYVVQGQRRLALAAVSARAPGGRFRVSIRLPADLHPGPAVIRTSQPGEVPLRIRVR